MNGTEKRQFRIHGSQVRLYAAAFNKAGFPFDIYREADPLGVGTSYYTFVVTMPVGFGEVNLDTLGMNRRRRRWRFPSIRRLAAVAIVLAVIVAAAWYLWPLIGAFLPGPAQQPAAPEGAIDMVKVALRVAVVVLMLGLLYFLRRPLMTLGGGLESLARGLGRMAGKGKAE